MRYADAIQFLYDLQWFGLKFGLENTRQLAALAGNPQDRLRFIHVAGTNGKGSTCALLESIYREAGLRVGLFTSPHLVHFSERLQIDRRPITEAEVIPSVAGMKELLKHFPSTSPPTFFEVVTVMALRYFADQGCDLVIWETGMGGRLDATNIVTPLASVITNIELDHEKWLGNTLPQIAVEKAGIIKPGIPVLTAAEEPEALEVIRSTAARLGAPLTEIRSSTLPQPPLDTIELPLLGDHQRVNASLALATVGALAPTLPVGEAAIRAGIEKVQWAGRLQLIPSRSGQRTLLDGAHNPAGATMLRAALERHFPGEAPALIFGVFVDKDWASMCRTLIPAAGSVWLVPVASNRSATPAELLPFCRACHPAGRVEICDSLETALEATRDAPFRLIAGSIYLVGQALERLQEGHDGLPEERALNEYQSAPRA